MELEEAKNFKVISGEMIGNDFCRDEYPGKSFPPEAVVEAASTEEVAALVKLCNAHRIPITVRGSGTGQAGGSVPVKGGVVLSLKGMNRILGYNEEQHTLRVQPGVMLSEIKAEAEKHGMYYPPDPGEQTATIGGNAATNAGGPCAVKYGRTQAYVADAVIVRADGAIAGLAGNEAVIGSEGTLGIITELTLRLVKKPGADAILLFPCDDVLSAINAAKAISDAGFEPSVAEVMDTDLIEFSGRVTGNPVFPVEVDGERPGATLMLTMEGEDDDAVMEKMEAVAALAEEGELSCLDILVGDTLSMKRDFWAAHNAFHSSMESAPAAWEVNVDVPFAAASGMMAYAKQTAEANGMKAYIHAHILTGSMHIHLVSDRPAAESGEAAETVCAAIYAEVLRLGGDTAGEYGIGYAKKRFISDQAAAAFRAQKEVFDPKGILNPEKRA